MSRSSILDVQTSLPECLPEPLLERGTLTRLSSGERLFSLGSPVASVYFVLEGECKAVRYQPDGQEVIMLRARQGEFFGESAMLVECYVCDGFATRDSSVVAFPVNLFRSLMQSESAFSAGFAFLMAASARRQCSRYERLRLGKARDRVLHLLSCEGDAQGNYPLKTPLVELARELGLEPETLYRVLGELEREGLIERERKNLRLIYRGN